MAHDGDAEAGCIGSLGLSVEAESEYEAGGEGGIRTHETVARLRHFQCRALDRTRRPLRGPIERSLPAASPLPRQSGMREAEDCSGTQAGHLHTSPPCASTRAAAVGADPVTPVGPGPHASTSDPSCAQRVWKWPSRSSRR